MKTRAIADGFECKKCGLSFTGPKPLVKYFRQDHENGQCVSG